MAKLNKNLHKAKAAKKDEFYTQLSDIENELRHYKDHFKGKVVYCNCDDPFESNFFKYFAINFNHLGLRKLISTSYAHPDLNNQALKIEITEVPDINKDGAVDLEDVHLLIYENVKELNGDGDFRSDECIELLIEADIVCTNPPFSLFREYVAQLVEYGKDFLIIGTQNAITYKEIFKLIKDNQLWLGMGHPKKFMVPDDYDKGIEDEDGFKWQSLGNVCWFTNLDVKKRHEPLTLYRKYDPEKYPKYDNYDAIEVSRVADIPKNYKGTMGLPITIVDKFCPEQFEILECHEPCINLTTFSKLPQFKNIPSRQINYGGKKCQKTYHRIFIRSKQ